MRRTLGASEVRQQVWDYARTDVRRLADVHGTPWRSSNDRSVQDMTEELNGRAVSVPSWSKVRWATPRAQSSTRPIGRRSADGGRRTQTERVPRFTQRSLISPGALSYLFFAYALIAFLLPSSIYEDLMGEPYFANGNFRMLSFAAGCVLCVKLGIAFAKIYKGDEEQVRSVQRSPDESQSKRRSVIIVAVVFIGLNLVSAAILVQRNQDKIVSALLMGEQTGDELKTNLVVEGAMLAVNPLLILAAWILYSLRLSGDRSRAVYILMLCSILLSAFISTIKLARYELLPLIIGMAVIKLLDQSRKGRRIGGKPLWLVLLYGSLALGVFVIFMNIRGQSSGDEGIASTFTGYTVASFNRLALLLDGQLTSTYGGTGAFVLNFLSNIPVIGSISESLPNSTSVFLQEFRDVQASGLDRGYIWLTMYGYYFADLGVWVFPYCFAFGVVAQMAWRSFLKSNVIGEVIYPYVATAMVLSFASYWISRPFIVAIGIFLVLYTLSLSVTDPKLRSHANSRGSGPERRIQDRTGRGFL